MPKQYYVAAVLMTMLAAPDRALSQVLSEDATGAIIPLAHSSSRFDEPICYMKTASGQMINRRSMCEERVSNTVGRNNRQQRSSSVRPRTVRSVRSGSGYADDSNSTQ